MLQIGRVQHLVVIRKASHGLYLTSDTEDVLLPIKEVNPKWDVGESLDVFVYLDSEDRPIATTRRPIAQIGDFAALKVVSVAAPGAFLDWGLERDLLLPHREWRSEIVEGMTVFVAVYLDPVTRRPAASMRLKRHLGEIEGLEIGDKVEVQLAEERSAGWQVVVEGKAYGFVPGIYGELGEKKVAYVRATDPELQLIANPVGRMGDLGARDKILELLSLKDGFLDLHDKSDPAEIQRRTGFSKAMFKRGVGMLLKEGKIAIEPYGLRAVNQQK
ncbi:MAG: GntR family transcriptional regulator [Armatimonadetes bacterium]|jgi:hypothetical protein|nr:GntR family transcriptional regulator [Armatimonadota bacterium]